MWSACLECAVPWVLPTTAARTIRPGMFRVPLFRGKMCSLFHTVSVLSGGSVSKLETVEYCRKKETFFSIQGLLWGKWSCHWNQMLCPALRLQVLVITNGEPVNQWTSPPVPHEFMFIDNMCSCQWNFLCLFFFLIELTFAFRQN